MYKILVVDDVDIVVDTLKDLLLSYEYNFEVLTANNGDEAIKVFSDNHVDIVLSDYNMPGKDGLDLLSFIKSKSKDTFFILSSGDFSQETLIKAIDLGVDRVIPKPISFENLDKILNNIIGIIEIKRENLNNIKLLSEYKIAVDDTSIVSKTDSRGIITYVNESFCRISGFSRDELLGKSQNIVRHPDVPKSVFKDLWDTIKSGKIWKGEVKNRAKNGEAYYVLATIIPIFNNDGSIKEYISVRNDITDIVHYREKMELVLEQKEKSIVSYRTEILETQREMIFTLGEVAESRSHETGLHVKRVAEYSFLLAKLYGLSEDEADMLRTISPMHDVGKVGIPDSILNKPGKLTDGEFKLMQDHTRIGYEMLNKSNRKLIKSAAIVAYEHHERWNGKGYPNSKSGEDIHIFARITAVADVFDALGHDRVYKKAWPLEKVLELLKNERGEHFDPKLIDLFFDNLDLFLDLKSKLDD